ncbi:MAG TPA: ABC transporter ATP-binding protein [Rhodopila sp.]|nr:ABC transporter ATP-binding protein [Rhodopila sp.]
MAAPSCVLQVKNLAARYGKIVALRDASLEIGEGEAVALLGANGSGKTTLLNTVCGFLPPAAGTISLGGETIGRLAPHRVFQRGVVQVAQGRELFGSMTVLDNLQLGAARRSGEGPDLAEIFGYFPRLQERQQQIVRTLSGGEQQMVAMGRALMSAPRLLLLDEPSGGLAPRFVEEIGNIMNTLKRQGKTMLLVEQNLALAAAVADRFYILRDGETVASGDGAALREDRQLFARTYYL